MAATLSRETKVPVKISLRSDGRVRFMPEEAPPSPDAAPPARKISAVVYTGAVVSRFYGDLIIDLSALEVPSRPLPLLYEHADPVGFATFSVENGEIVANGQLLSGTEDADKVASYADQGYPWEMSVGVDLDAALLGEGLTAEVNGQTVEGPIWITTSARLREASFVVVGADAETSAEVLTRSPTMFRKTKNKESTMPTTENPQTEAVDVSARIAELRAVSGATGDDILIAIEKEWSAVELKAHMADKLAGQLAERDATIKTMSEEAEKLRRAAQLKRDEAGADPVVDATPAAPGKAGVKLTGDPEKDWESNEGLRKAWESNGGKRAWDRYVGLQKSQGLDYREEAMCV